MPVSYLHLCSCLQHVIILFLTQHTPVGVCMAEAHSDLCIFPVAPQCAKPLLCATLFPQECSHFCLSRQMLNGSACHGRNRAACVVPTVAAVTPWSGIHCPRRERDP
eukprot:EG_transcript_46434